MSLRALVDVWRFGGGGGVSSTTSPRSRLRAFVRGVNDGGAGGGAVFVVVRCARGEAAANSARSRLGDEAYMTDEDVVVAAMRCLDGVLGATSIAFVSTTGTPVDDDSRRREDEEVSPSCLDRDTVAGDKNGLLLLPRGVPSDGDARDVDDGFLGVDKGRDSVRDERSNKEEEEDADGDLCMVEEARKGFESAVASTAAVDDVLGIADDDERDADPPPRVDEEAVAPLAATTALDSFR